jgi:hypothetical protein
LHSTKLNAMKWSSAQYGSGASFVWAALAVVLHIPFTLAWDSPQPLIRRSSEATIVMEKGDFTERVRRILSRHLADTTTTMTTTAADACPVCNDSVEATTSETGPLRTVIAKIKGSLSEALTGDSTTTTAWDTTVASTASVVSALESAGAHFTALAAQTQTLKTSALAATADATPATTPSSPLIVATFDLLEDITTGAADYLYQVTGLMTRAGDSSVGMVTGMILSTLGLMERVSLGMVNVLVDALTALTAPPPAVQSEAVDSADIEVLLSLLAAGAAPGGVFSDVLAFLEANSDDSGLAAILTNAATDMQGMADRLSVFINLANAALASAAGKTNATAVATVQADTINEIISLIVGIISAIISLIVDIITTIISLIAGIISAVLNLILGIISAIINLIVSILNAILGIFSFQVQADAIGAASVGALMAMKIVGIMLDNPSVPVGVAKCALELTSCPYPVLDDLDCRTKALVCQNDALSQIIPS